MFLKKVIIVLIPYRIKTHLEICVEINFSFILQFVAQSSESSSLSFLSNETKVKIPIILEMSSL